MGKTRNNSLRMQQAVRSIFEDYRQKQGCLGHVYEEAACGCNNALQMWRGPKGEKGDPGPQGPKGDNAGSFLVDAEFVVDPAGQDPGAYLKLVLIDVQQQEQVVYVDLSELEDVYTAGDGIDIHSMVVAARLGAGLTFDQQGNITSAYQFCDGLDETSNVVKVKLDANNNILGFAGSGCKGLTATVNLTQAASGVALVLTGAGGTVLNTVPLNGGTGITIEKSGNGFTWLVDPSDLVSSTAGNNLSISNNKLYVGNSALSYTVGDGVFTLTNASGTTSTVTLPTVVKSLDRADMVCIGENAPYLRLTFKRDNGQNLYQDIDMSCLATAEMSLDVSCDEVIEEGEREPFVWYNYVVVFQNGSQIGNAPATSSASLSVTMSPAVNTPVTIELYSNVSAGADGTNNYLLENVLLDDLIAAGERGMLMTEDTCMEEGSGIPCNLNVFVSCEEESGVYTFTFTTGELDVTETVLTADLVSGENRVDMKPLLEHIGGKVQEVMDPDKATIVPIAGQNKAGMVFDDGTGFATQQDMCDWTNEIDPDEIIADDESVTCYYETLPSYVSLWNWFVDSAQDAVDTTYYCTIANWDTCTDINTSVAAMMQAPVELTCLNDDDDIIDCPQKIYVQCEQVEDEHGIGLKFTFLQGATKNVLCLEPSCDSCIDLSPAIGDSLVKVEGSFTSPDTLNITTTTKSGDVAVSHVDLSSLHDSVPIYQGATASAAGVTGTVPPATSAEKDSFLKGDGTWEALPTNHVTTDTNQTITGVKTFAAGYFGNVEALTEDQNNPGEYPVDVSHATAFTLTLDDDAEFDFTGVPMGRSACFSLKLEYGGDYTVTWPSNVHWCNDIEPELTSGGTDILTFITFDGGTNWYGTLSMTGITQ